LRELALHILDIAENSISAGASHIRINVEEDLDKDRLTITITDNGKGMNAETLARITDPFITSRTTRKVGLGIPFFKAAAESCEGHFKIQSQPGQGTTVTAEFKRSHIDRMPLGDLAGTLQTLIIGTPDVHWTFDYRINDEVFHFDDEPIKEILDGVPLSDPSVMRYLRDTLRTGIDDLRQAAGLPTNQ
jgi:anti-sigma regulatory factor (Ser/Thr protein kinase)